MIIKYKKYLENISRRNFIKTASKAALIGATLTTIGGLASCNKNDDVIPTMHKYRLDVKDKYNSINSISLKDGGTIVDHDKEFYTSNEVKCNFSLKKSNEDISINIVLYHNDYGVSTLSISRKKESTINQFDYEIKFTPSICNYNVRVTGDVEEMPDAAITQIYIGSDVEFIKGIGRAKIEKSFTKNDVLYPGIKSETNACGPETRTKFKVYLDDILIRQVYNYSCLASYASESTIYLNIY